MEWKICFEDHGLLVVTKPRGMPTQPDKTGDPDLLTALEQHCGHPLGLLHRLDRPVGGVMLFAKTKPMEATLAKEMQAGKITKKYRAVVLGTLPQEKGSLTDYLRKNACTNLSEVVDSKHKDGKKAVLQYTSLGVVETAEGTLTLVEITLETGRHHQIRVQLANAGAPIWGDKKYNTLGKSLGKTEIALWAFSLSGIHPVTKKRWLFEDFPKGKPFDLFQ